MDSGVGISWKLGVDGISLFMVVLSGLIFPIPCCSSPQRERQVLLRLDVAARGRLYWVVPGARNLLVLLCHFEFVLVPMYLPHRRMWVSRSSQLRRRFRSFPCTRWRVLAFCFVGMLAMVFIATGPPQQRPVTFDLVALQSTQASRPTEARWCVLGVRSCFCSDDPIFPLHTWLADLTRTHPRVVIVRPLVMRRGYGLVRFGVSLGFPKAAHDDCAVLLERVGGYRMLYGAICLREWCKKTYKRLVAYFIAVTPGFVCWHIAFI